jgi:hypothetical protein
MRIRIQIGAGIRIRMWLKARPVSWLGLTYNRPASSYKLHQNTLVLKDADPHSNWCRDPDLHVVKARQVSWLGLTYSMPASSYKLHQNTLVLKNADPHSHWGRDPDPHVLVKFDRIAGQAHLQQARLVLQITSEHN